MESPIPSVNPTAHQKHEPLDYTALLHWQSLPGEPTREDTFKTALVAHDRVPFEYRSTRDFDNQRRAPAPDEAARHSLILDHAHYAERLRPHSESIALLQEPLSEAANSMVERVRPLADARTFAHHYEDMQRRFAGPEADYFTWSLTAPTIAKKLRATTLIFREPGMITDQQLLENGFDTYGCNELLEISLACGSQSRCRNEASVNIDPNDATVSLYNTAYMQLSQLVQRSYVTHGAVAKEIRYGMQMHTPELTPIEAVPAADILQRGLIAYDSMLMVAAIDKTAGQAIFDGRVDVPDAAYLRLIREMAAYRPLSTSYGAHNQEIGTMIAGIDMSALRCLVYSDDPSELAAAHATLQKQTRQSFGPEFLEMVDHLHNRLAADPAKQAQFIDDIADRMATDDRDALIATEHHIAGELPPIAVIPHEVYQADTAVDTDSLIYHIPYAHTAAYLEDILSQVNPALLDARMQRISLEYQRAAELVAHRDDARPRRLQDFHRFITTAVLKTTT